MYIVVVLHFLPFLGRAGLLLVTLVIPNTEVVTTSSL
jgi:hypothetical protein